MPIMLTLICVTETARVDYRPAVAIIPMSSDMPIAHSTQQYVKAVC